MAYRNLYEGLSIPGDNDSPGCVVAWDLQYCANLNHSLSHLPGITRAYPTDNRVYLDLLQYTLILLNLPGHTKTWDKVERPGP